LIVDWQGRKISEMRYTPWGETRWAWELDGAGYTDKLFASHTTQNRSYAGSLIDFGARSLNPTTGRFISADALVTDPNNPAAYNRYAFVGNNPLRYTDPDGHCWPICTMLAGAAIGAAVGVGIQVLANAAAGKPLDTDVGKAALVGGVSGAIGGLMPGAGSVVGAVVVGAVEGAVTGQVACAVDNVASGRNWDAGLGNVGDMALDATIGGVTGGVGYSVGKFLKGGVEKASSGLSKSQTLFHYTDEEGYKGILNSQEIWATTNKTSGDKLLGEGVYLTDVKPGSMSKAGIHQTLYNGAPGQSESKVSRYVEIDVAGLKIKQQSWLQKILNPRPHVFVRPGKQNLNIRNRVVSSGSTPR
jgi:RHS repeat-associated protein